MIEREREREMEIDKQTDGQGRREWLLFTVESKKMKNKKQTQAPRYRKETGDCQRWEVRGHMK